MFLLTALIVKDSHILAGIYFIFDRLSYDYDIMNIDILT